MSFIQREIERLEAALAEQHENYGAQGRLRAALDALLWTQEPLARRAPADDILESPLLIQANNKSSFT
jgi:hypothetical protein